MVPSLQGARYLTPAPSLVDVLESSAVLVTGGRWGGGRGLRELAFRMSNTGVPDCLAFRRISV